MTPADLKSKFESLIDDFTKSGDVGDLERLTTFVEALCDTAHALEVFAAMDRPNCDLSELACERGIASDMTILQSKDFRRAAEALSRLEELSK